MRSDSSPIDINIVLDLALDFILQKEYATAYELLTPFYNSDRDNLIKNDVFIIHYTECLSNLGLNDQMLTFFEGSEYKGALTIKQLVHEKLKALLTVGNNTWVLANSLKIASIFKKLGDVRLAKVFFSKQMDLLHSQNQTSLEVFLEYIDCTIQLGHFLIAIKALDQYLSKIKKYPLKLVFLLSDLYIKTKKFKKAEKLIQNALNFQYKLSLIAELARLYVENKFFSEAIALLQRYIDPKNPAPRLLLQLIDCYQAQGLLNDALKVFDHYFYNVGNDEIVFEITIRKAKLLAKMGRKNISEKILDQLFLVNTETDVKRRILQAWLQLSLPEKVIAFLDVIDWCGDYLTRYFIIIDAYRILITERTLMPYEKKQKEEKLAEILNAVSKLPYFEQNAELVWCYVRACVAIGLFDKAIACLNSIKEIDDNYFLLKELFLHKNELFRNNEMLQSFAKKFNHMNSFERELLQLSELLPNQPALVERQLIQFLTPESKSFNWQLTFLHVSTLVKLKNPQAIAVIDAELSIRPDVVELLLLRAIFFQNVKRFFESENALLLIVKKFPYHPDAYILMMEAYQVQKKPWAACALMLEAKIRFGEYSLVFKKLHDRFSHDVFRVARENPVPSAFWRQPLHDGKSEISIKPDVLNNKPLSRWVREQPRFASDFWAYKSQAVNVQSERLAWLDLAKPRY